MVSHAQNANEECKLLHVETLSIFTPQG